MSLLTDVETLLTSVSNIYIASMPDTPDSVVVLYPTGGFSRDMTGTMVEEPTFQVLVRGANYETVMGVIDSVKDKLHCKSTTKIMIIEQMGDVQPLGQDEKKRWRFTINFRCLYRR